jgi:hypothetical protein
MPTVRHPSGAWRIIRDDLIDPLFAFQPKLR